MTAPRDVVALPKGHLHLHLEGAMRPSTLEELARRDGITIPEIRGYGSFTAFADMYLAACVVLRSDDDLRRLMREVIEDAAESGATWLEVGARPTIHAAKFDGGAEHVLEVWLDEAQVVGERLGVGVGLLLTADRIEPLEVAVEEAQLAARYAGRGVVSFGLANDEVGHPPEDFEEAFAIAREAGLLSAPHAGELEGPASVWGALDVLRADRIQHGVRSVEDPALLDRLAESQVCLDVCPTSNQLLNVFPVIEEHPLPHLLELGIRCSLNGDDPLFFGASLAEEYELCRRVFGLSDEQLASIARSSIDASGAPAELKASSVRGIDAWLASPGGPDR